MSLRVLGVTLGTLILNTTYTTSSRSVRGHTIHHRSLVFVLPDTADPFLALRLLVWSYTLALEAISGGVIRGKFRSGSLVAE